MKTINLYVKAPSRGSLGVKTNDCSQKLQMRLAFGNSKLLLSRLLGVFSSDNIFNPVSSYPKALSLFYILLHSQSVSFASPASYSSPPLTEVITQVVDNCTEKSQLTLPIVSRGADIATIFSNGLGLETSAESIFEQNKLNLKLEKEDVLTDQIDSFLRCDSPFLRATSGMINLASEVLNKDPRTKPIVFYQSSWSEGWDALVVKKDILRPDDLRGKTIALQEYGPHIDYLNKILTDAGLSKADVNLKWTKKLTGAEDSPAKAFKEKGIDAAMTILPDALTLSSGGEKGTGSNDSVKGAKILLSTKSANKIIADVYAVRSDFYQQNKSTVQSIVKSLVEASSEVKKLASSKSKSKELFSSSAKILLGKDLPGNDLLEREDLLDNIKELYGSIRPTGLAENNAFFQSPTYPRSFNKLSDEAESSLLKLGLLQAPQDILTSDINFKDFSNFSRASLLYSKKKESFNKGQVIKTVNKKQQEDSLEESVLFSLEVNFKPKQESFSSEIEKEAFEKVVNLVSTYGGAVLFIEGHADPLVFLNKEKDGEPEVALKRLKQATKNLSLRRANALRDSLVKFAKEQGVSLDESQLTVTGKGIENPKTGICKKLPCAPKTEADWLSNMRVELKVIQVEADTSVFKPL